MKNIFRLQIVVMSLLLLTGSAVWAQSTYVQKTRVQEDSVSDIAKTPGKYDAVSKDYFRPLRENERVRKKSNDFRSWFSQRPEREREHENRSGGGSAILKPDLVRQLKNERVFWKVPIRSFEEFTRSDFHRSHQSHQTTFDLKQGGSNINDQFQHKIELTDGLTRRNGKSPADLDQDGILNDKDNCLLKNNADQSDYDHDGVGDECDNCPADVPGDQNDYDKDGVGDICDNCPINSNPDEEDSDSDGFGDACDNCKNEANADQNDWNEDGIGNVCQDSDGDGLLDSKDNCVKVQNPDQIDENNNGVGDVCDAECLPPELTIVPSGSCTYHDGDYCGSFEWGSCDPGFDDDEVVVESGQYKVDWTTKYVDFVIEDCHNYGKGKGDLNFDGDSGSISFPWDGPMPGQSNPAGYHADLQRLYNETLNPLPEAHAGGLVVSGRHGGKFECVVTAYGRCGQKVETGYWYSCP